MYSVPRGARTFTRFEEVVGQGEGDKAGDGENEEGEELALAAVNLASSPQ